VGANTRKRASDSSGICTRALAPFQAHPKIELVTGTAEDDFLFKIRRVQFCAGRT